MHIVKFISTLADPKKRFFALENHGFYRWMSDERFIRKRFRLKMESELNLEEPKTYNEKLQWLKLYDRKPIYTSMVDKYEAKKIVASAIGKTYVIPTLGVWNHFENIDFTELPNQFVLKCTHDSGSVVICRDRSNFDRKSAERKLKKCLRKNYYWHGREWPYKNVKPRIIAEPYLEDSASHDLKDYKIFTFNGAAKALFIATDREKVNVETKFDFYDRNFNHLNIVNGHPNAEVLPQKPKNLELMLSLAEKLSGDIPALRVDFYEVDGKVYFGEFTFSHWSGMMPFEPEEWDYTFGSWITLPDRIAIGE